MGGATRGGRELDQTPTWAVALVSAVIVVISIILEKALHAIGETFHRKKKNALYEALEKIKTELMVLGFISLILTFGQNYIVQMCIPTETAIVMLPCPLRNTTHSAMGGHGVPADHGAAGGHGVTAEHGAAGGHGVPGEHGAAAGHVATGEHDAAAGHGATGEHDAAAGHSATGEQDAPAGYGAAEGTGHEPPQGDEKEAKEHHRRLLWYEHRFLSADSVAKECEKGHVPLISVNGLHQLHIFIFFLAVFHVFYSAITMLLGRLKIRGWKEWEQQVAHDYNVSNDPTRFRLTHETSFVRDHTSFWTRNPILFYIVCFYRQFFRSVRKADYLTMRHGFISVHLTPGSKFNFQKYIKRSLEDDFKVVVGIPPLLWLSAVVYLLLNVDGWQAMLWLSIMPLFIILAVGTKLQAIITQMAVEIQERHAVVQGIPLVQVSDRHFWFSWPKLVLHLIHLTLFQNAFEITYFIWISYEFGLHSCFHDNITLAIIRCCLGFGAQFLCSYITLPLYALVTQMGSTMKRSIFDEQTSKALMNWHKNAKKKNNDKSGQPRTRTLGGSPGDSPEGSPHAMRNEMTNAGVSHSGGGTANITASVDIPVESHGDKLQNGTGDLLTGP